MTSLVQGLHGKPSEGYPKGYPFVAGRNNVIACAKHFVGDGGTDKAGMEIPFMLTIFYLLKFYKKSLCSRYEEFIKDLLSLVESGEIPITRIDNAVERILRVKFVAGLFGHPLSDRSLIGVVGCKASFRHLW
ncbi:glycosyl hydrolase family 3 protein [Cucumis melo var. makuwa]|uniref:Glycosyl hydrolase family 3 protein n=1 Tax=Cucumis melo var. makuwa TaxID=1194695 RepID=A0A5D3BXN0_CUCMM|nr:glycosyl hydrolase family 3 protein [Cucumis melo var. makuwa]TYK04277.1 glycosyl hydrolase family 3 protein [Cucumis melo var. makuwa]